MEDYLEFRQAFQRLVRALGNAHPSRTPCGMQLSPSAAHGLMAIARAEQKSLSQKDLCRLLGVDKSNVTRICELLTQKGWIQRMRSKEDQRVLVLSITTKGKRLAEQLEASSSKFLKAVLAEFPSSDQRNLIQSLQKLSIALDAAGKGNSK